MTKVITYGTYDLLHEGHIRLLERAKALGDYLIVGVTADGFDLARGKINVQQPLIDRIEAVKATGLADQIVVEEYEGQKIDDIRRFGVDIFTVGSDWVGKFDYLNEFCKVVYLDRTQGISSSMIRSDKHSLKIGIIGDNNLVNKFFRESGYVNGVEISGIYSDRPDAICEEARGLLLDSLNDVISGSDALYVASVPEKHFYHVWRGLEAGKHVLCEAPVCMRVKDYQLLRNIAEEKHLVLMDGVKTAYSLAFSRLMLLVKGGIIGDVIAIDTTCTSLLKETTPFTWNSICWWGPTALLPITDLFGCDCKSANLVVKPLSEAYGFNSFTYGSIIFPHGVATFKVGQGVKSEGEMVISGTKGYVYVPAPWWKTDYFEVRYENPNDNKRYFYQLDGEGIRNEIRTFHQLIEGGIGVCHIAESQTEMTIRIVEETISSETFKL